MENEEAKKFGAQGGKKRAANMTKAERQKVAVAAAEARWAKGLPLASYSGVLKIGDLAIPCAVLEDGTRVLTTAGFLRAIGRSERPMGGKGSRIEGMAPFLDVPYLKPFVSKELADSSRPVPFRIYPGGKAFGYRADLLPQVCDVYLRARDEGKLSEPQVKFARACEMIVRGLATVGIIALVDEATGFQADRSRDALAKILEAFVQKELRKWIRTFPADYYEQLCRLRDVPYPPTKKNFPSYFGHLTNNIVYDRLAPGVKEELKRVTAKDERGRRKELMHQHLTEDTGVPKLAEHLAATTALMKISPDYATFEGHLNKALPRWDDTLPLQIEG